MTMMLTELYDALRAAEGVGDDRARRAAEAVAAFDNRFAGLERQINDRCNTVDRRIDEVETSLSRRIDGVKADLDLRVEEVKGSLRVQQWMLATLVAGVAALLVRAFA
jgi:uncharacterized Ntn-hydrolase superfamily protein